MAQEAEVRQGLKLQVPIADRRRGFELDRFGIFSLLTSGVSVLAQSSLILTSWGKLPPQVPIFYSRTWGEAMLGAPAALWILPLAVVFVTAFNFFLVSLFFKNNLFLARTLQAFSLLVAAVTLWDSAKIISLLV